jgi:hypothetical protein
MNDRVAILVVNGGKDPKNGKWIQLCIDKILEHTEWSNYQVYVWNNNVEDLSIVDFLKNIPLVTLVQANPSEKLSHIHAVPLQRLYELVCNDKDKPKYIVVMDSDAHPIQKGWLKQLISSLDSEVVLSGVWRDELKKAIKPYIHASCLCTTVDFIEKNNLRLDFIAPNTETKIHDTLSILTETAEQIGLKTHKLYRSNKNNFHRLMGGLYGDLIYHHGAGSRVSISFWDEEKNTKNTKKYQEMARLSANLLFENYDRYLGWLRGNVDDKEFNIKMTRLGKIEIYEENFSAQSKFKKSYSKDTKNVFHQLKALLKNFSTGELIKYLPVKRKSLVANQQEEKLSGSFPLMLHPFTADEMKSVPEEWRISEPDFVGIAAAKAGTSWWYSLLRDHPQIIEHRLFSEKKQLKTKELHYFLHFGYQGLSNEHILNYRQAFASPKGSICGEWSVLYLCYPHCIEYLAEVAPSTKILVLLRNPVDRTISHLNHILSNRVKQFNFNSEQHYLFKVYSVYPEAILHSLYAYGLRRLLRYFDRSQILLLQYEKCKADPYQEIARTYRFLGVDDQYQPKGIERAVNRQEYIIQSLKSEERQRLAAYFADDVRATVEMFPEIDISLWSDFID